MAQFVFILLCSLMIIVPTHAAENDSDAVVYPSEQEYAWVYENLEAAILSRGLVISGVLHIGEMLERTGPDLGYNDATYLHAEAFEFCSATITQLMTRADPTNIGVCPFTVAVYVTAAEPETVYVVYHKPVIAQAPQAEAEAIALLDGIAREASE